MMSAIVLGDSEHQIWSGGKPNQAKHIRYLTETIVSLENEREGIEEY